MIFLDRQYCPIHSNTKMHPHSHSFSDTCFGKTITKIYKSKHCPDCIFEYCKNKTVYYNNFTNFIYYGNSGGIFGVDDIAEEGIAIYDINKSIGFHYYSSEIECNIYDMKVH